jgi:hypothetical protein
MHRGNLPSIKLIMGTPIGLESTYNTLRYSMTEGDTKMLVFIHELMRNELYSLMCKRGRARDGEYMKIINLSNKALELLND